MTVERPTGAPAATAAPRLRALIGDFFVYGSGNLLLKALGFLLLPLYTRHLAPADYGALEVADVIVAVLGSAVGLGQNFSLERFYIERDGERRRRLAGSALVATSFGSILGALLLAGFAGPIAAGLFGAASSASYLMLAFVALRLPFHSIALLTFLVLRMKRARMSYLAMTVAVSLADVALTLFLVVGRGLGVHGVLLGGLAASVMQAALGAFVLRRETRPSLPDFESFSYGLALLPALLLMILMRSLDRGLLVILTDVDELGLYGVAGRFAGLVWLVEASIAVAWPPLLFRWHAAGDHYRIRSAGTVATVAFLAAAVFVGLVAADLIPLMTPEAFHAAVPLVAGLSFAAAGNGAAWIARSGLMIARRTAIITAIDVVSLALFLGGGWLVIPRWGALGASIVAGICFWNSAVLSHLVARRRHPEVGADAPILALILAAALAATLAGIAAETAIARYGIFGIFLLFAGLALARSLTRRNPEA